MEEQIHTYTKGVVRLQGSGWDLCLGPGFPAERCIGFPGGQHQVVALTTAQYCSSSGPARLPEQPFQEHFALGTTQTQGVCVSGGQPRQGRSPSAVHSAHLLARQHQPTPPSCSLKAHFKLPLPRPFQVSPSSEPRGLNCLLGHFLWDPQSLGPSHFQG